MTEPTDVTAGLPGFDPVQMQQLLQFNVAQLQQGAMIIPQKDKKIRRQKFTPEEDEILRNLVSQFGESDWGTIAQHFQNRTLRQCRDRWKHYLSPDVMTGNWTEEEDQLLLRQVEEMGPRWSNIAAFFPHRTDIGVKNHWISITNKKNKDVRERGHQRAILLPLGSNIKIEPPGGLADGSIQIPMDIPPGDDQGSQLLPVGLTADPDPTTGSPQ